MRNLNIPLKRHTKTIRPLGRVVWLLVGLLIVGGFLAYRFGALWFNRGTILSLAPSDTILAIELKLNEQTAPFLLDWLAGVPLLSDRSLELRDLAPYVHGDLAVFVTKDGERSVAIRTSENSFPSDLLKKLSIVTQEKGSLMLLSSTLVPINGIKSFPSPILPSIGKTWIGRVMMPKDGIAGSLFVSSANVTFVDETSGRIMNEHWSLPEATVALGGLSWGEDEPFLPGLKRLLSEKSLILENTQSIDLAVVSAESGLETLLKIEAPEITSDGLIRELEKIGAFARPTIVRQALPDGSELEEILVQPELVSVEEISTNLGVSYRIPTGGGSYILATLHDESILLSNNQTLLENSARETMDVSATDCPVSSNRVNPTFFAEQVSLDHFNQHMGLLSEIFDNFSMISFEFKKYSTIVRLCRI